MGRYASEAKRHAEKIEYFHKNAGEAGYAQAVYHRDKLSQLMLSASRSKSDKADQPVIDAIIESADKLMDEMKRRQGGDDT